MPAAIREITDDLDVPQSTMDFGTVQSGVPSAAVTRRVWNNLSGVGVVDSIYGAAFTAEARLTASGVDFKADQTALLLAGAAQSRIVGGTDDVEWAVTDWLHQGGGERLELPVIPGPIGGAYVEVEFRINLPATVKLQDTQISWQIDESRSGAIPASHVANVIPTGRDDSTVYHVIDGGAIDPGALAFELDVPRTTWLHQGRAVFEQVADDDYPVPATDGNGDALAAGEAYILLLTRSAATGLRQTKGIKATAPLDDTDRPAVPAGDQVHAWVTVDDAGAVTIEAPASADPYYFEAIVSGLNLSIGPGDAYVDGRATRSDTATDLGAQPINSAIDVYVLRDGSITTEASTDVPTGRPMRIYRVVTDGTEITTVVDHRPLQGGGFTA